MNPTNRPPPSAQMYIVHQQAVRITAVIVGFSDLSRLIGRTLVPALQQFADTVAQAADTLNQIDWRGIGLDDGDDNE